MDDLLAKAAIVSHQLNNYTGTDYSGIEALRREIHEQGMLHVLYPCLLLQVYILIPAQKTS